MNRNRPFLMIAALAVFALALSGCGLFSGSADENAAAEGSVERVLMPTFTPTSFVEAPTATPTVAFAAPAAEAVAATPEASATPASEPTATPAPRARLIVTQDGINVRTGPGTQYGLGGTASLNAEFDIIAKSPAGDWWQVCCLNGEPVWVFGQLARVENAENVPVAQNIPAPIAAQPVAQPTQPPAAAEPTATPAPPANDPCANIGGDGCKFKVTGGPAFASNGGTELKLTFAFIHSGVEGGQPQGSYFVVLLKDGQNVGVSDSVRSFDPSVAMRTGPNGTYNYEYKVGMDRIPGGSVAGNYTVWVLDGNGERDSRDFNFTVPEGQGEVWIKFDQA